jgi:hypothetical protein
VLVLVFVLSYFLLSLYFSQVEKRLCYTLVAGFLLLHVRLDLLLTYSMDVAVYSYFYTSPHLTSPLNLHRSLSSAFLLSFLYHFPSFFLSSGHIPTIYFYFYFYFNHQLQRQTPALPALTPSLSLIARWQDF